MSVESRGRDGEAAEDSRTVVTEG